MAGSHVEKPGEGDGEGEFLQWLSSEAGQQPFKASDTVRTRLEDVELDVGQRLFLWPDGSPRSFAESVAYLHQEEPQVSAQEAANLLLDWMEDPERLDESGAQSGLERMLDQWIEELDGSS